MSEIARAQLFERVELKAGVHQFSATGRIQFPNHTESSTSTNSVAQLDEGSYDVMMVIAIHLRKTPTPEELPEPGEEEKSG